VRIAVAAPLIRDVAQNRVDECTNPVVIPGDKVCISLEQGGYIMGQPLGDVCRVRALRRQH
jgi:hypothetical protein